MEYIKGEIKHFLRTLLWIKSTHINVHIMELLREVTTSKTKIWEHIYSYIVGVYIGEATIDWKCEQKKFIKTTWKLEYEPCS